MKNRPSQLNFIRIVKKFFLSAFVAVTFVLYALHKPNSSSSANLGPTVPGTGATQTSTLDPNQNAVVPTDTTAPTSTPEPTQPPVLAVPTIANREGDDEARPVIIPPTPTTVPPTAVAQAPAPASNQSQFKDGTYTGPQVDAQWGMVQVQAVIQQGKIANVQVVQYPSDRRTSVRINNQAVPYLQQEAVQLQSANVDIITGATLTSEAFQMSLQYALNQAKGKM